MVIKKSERSRNRAAPARARTDEPIANWTAAYFSDVLVSQLERSQHSGALALTVCARRRRGRPLPQGRGLRITRTSARIVRSVAR